MNKYIINTYIKQYNPMPVDKNYKAYTLENFLRFFNDNLFINTSSYFSTRNITGDLNSLNLEQRSILLSHLKECHEKINKSHYGPHDFSKNHQDLFYKTCEILKQIKPSENEKNRENAANQFLLLVAHRNGTVHDKYTRNANILLRFLENNLNNEDSVDTINNGDNFKYKIDKKNIDQMNKYMVNQYIQKYRPMPVDKNYKSYLLENFLRFFNDNLFVNNSNYFSARTINANLSNLSLTLEQRDLLLSHLKECHEKINKSHYGPHDFSKNHQDLFYKTCEILRKIKPSENEKNIENAANQFLLLVTHRNGTGHDKYTRNANILLRFLENNLSNEYILQEWAGDNNNKQSKEAMDKIINCINNQEETTLDLSGLKLMSLPPIIIFSRLKHIKVLNLSNNELDYIEIETFNNLINLEKLDLSNNKLTEIRHDTLDPLVNLKELDLSHNLIEEFNSINDKNNQPSFIFNSLVNLKELNFSDNKITKIQKGTFNGMKNLITVKFKNNNIQQFPQEAFDISISNQLVKSPDLGLYFVPKNSESNE